LTQVLTALRCPVVPRTSTFEGWDVGVAVRPRAATTAHTKPLCTRTQEVADPSVNVKTAADSDD